MGMNEVMAAGMSATTAAMTPTDFPSVKVLFTRGFDEDMKTWQVVGTCGDETWKSALVRSLDPPRALADDERSKRWTFLVVEVAPLARQPKPDESSSIFESEKLWLRPRESLRRAQDDLYAKIEAQIRDNNLDPKEWELVTLVEDAEVSAAGRPAIRLTAKLVRRKL
jgi:hypothetical protein